MSKSNRKQLLTAEQETRCRAIAAKNPRAVRPSTRLALHCWRSGALSEALEWIDRCLQIDANEINYYRIRANILVDMQQSARAVETAFQAIKVAPESVIPCILTVRMLLADLKPARAQEVLDATLKLKPEAQQLRLMESLQAQILNMTQQAEHDPLKWLICKFRKRLSNVASER